MRQHGHNYNQAFVLFYTLVLVSVFLVIITTTVNSAITEFRASSDEVESLKAFYAADTAIECVRYYQEKTGAFNSTVPAASYNCGVGMTGSVGGPGGTTCVPLTRNFTLNGFSNGACVEVKVTTDQDPEDDTLCTMQVQAKGKNTCGSGASVERTRWEGWTGLPIGTGNLQGGLIGHWQLDESSGITANDVSSGNHDGTRTNGPIWRPSGGQIAGALEFDGTDDYVTMGDVLDFDRTDPFSISVWFKRAFGTLDNDRLVTKGSFATEFGYSLSIRGDLNSTNAPIRFEIKESSGRAARFDIMNLSSSDTSWHHVVVTHTGTGSFKGYRDGVSQTLNVIVNSLASGTGTSITGHPFSIGARDVSSGNMTPFPGHIDDVRIYNRALSPSEVLQLCRNGGGSC